MKLKLLTSLAYGLGLSLTGVAAAENGFPQAYPHGYAQPGSTGAYVPPAHWNTFHPQAADFQAAAGGISADPAAPHYRAATPATATGWRQPVSESYASPEYLPSLTGAGGTQAQPVGVNWRNAQQDLQSHAPSSNLGGDNGLAGDRLGGHAEPVPAPPGQPLAGGQHGVSPYMSAANAPWEAGTVGSALAQQPGPGFCPDGMCGLGGDLPRPELFPWFGGADLLFWSMANRTNQRLLLETGMPSTTLLNTRQVDPGPALGYDLFFGRYFGCGRYAASVNYLNFNPGTEAAYASTGAMPGDFYAAMPGWENIGYYDDPTDPGSDYYSMKDIFDRMADYYVRRNVGFQGIEANFWCFGLGGARRVAPACGTGLSCGLGTAGVGYGDGHHVGHLAGSGFGGFGGPLERPCVGTCQIALLQGFRWFQFRDDFTFAGVDHDPMGMDPVRGDQYFDTRARNDLFGYQFGGRFNYCVAPRVNLGVGGKMGVYANCVEVQQRIGGDDMPARYSNGNPDNRHHVDRTRRDTVLAGLGELDLGGGIRLTDAWTLRSGYRVLAVSNVATTPSLLQHEMFSPSLSAREVANDSVILHGAYLGTEFNW